MKTKAVKGNRRTNKLDLPSVFLICIFFFLAGFSASSLFSHSQEHEYDLRLRPRARLLEESTQEKTEYHLLKAGDSGAITLIDSFSEQCESIIEMARGGSSHQHWHYAREKRRRVQRESEQGRVSGVFMNAAEDETGILDAIEEKIAKATKIPRTQRGKFFLDACGYETFNILRNEVGQKFNSHYDAFDEAEYGPLQSQRVASFLLYLTDVPEGGETMFPYENGFNREGNVEDCIGLRVRPRKGDPLLFYSLLPNDTILIRPSAHGSCPVIKAEKWVATKWIRNQVHDD